MDIKVLLLLVFHIPIQIVMDKILYNFFYRKI